MSPQILIALAACLITGLAIANLASLAAEQNDASRVKTGLIDRLSEANAQNRQSQATKAKLINLARLPGLGWMRVKPDSAARQLQLDSQLSLLLDLTALGMRAGMAFDQAFELALRRSSCELAVICLARLEVWQKGLISRERGLHELEQQIQTVLFSRLVALVIRALKYGAPMAQLLLALSNETRRDIRARREEMVAKAPVKMLVPTGSLILPAMLLLVLGPILLDFIGKM